MNTVSNWGAAFCNTLPCLDCGSSDTFSNWGAAFCNTLPCLDCGSSDTFSNWGAALYNTLLFWDDAGKSSYTKQLFILKCYRSTEVHSSILHIILRCCRNTFTYCCAKGAPSHSKVLQEILFILRATGKPSRSILQQEHLPKLICGRK